MITPNKYTNLDLSLFSISSLMLSILITNQIISYDELLKNIIIKRGESAKSMFPPALSFLYSLNKIIYHKSIDSFELIV